MIYTSTEMKNNRKTKITNISLIIAEVMNNF